MPVRRWDFRSWARLGRPIIREFQTPSLRIATVVVDMGMNPVLSAEAATTALERMLRCIVTALDHWHRHSMVIQMHVTSERSNTTKVEEVAGATEATTLLIQLASAHAIEAQESDRYLEDAYSEWVSGSSVLFTTRDVDLPTQASSGGCSVVRLDSSPVESVQPASVRVKHHQLEPSRRDHVEPEYAQ